MSERRPRRLSAAEWDVMKVIWDHGPMAMGDIDAQLAGGQEWSYSTVKTLVRRLTDKGWLTTERVGNSFLYRAAVTQKNAVRTAVKEFSERVLDGVLSPFVAYFAEEKNLSAADRAQLEAILERYEQSKGGRR